MNSVECAKRSMTMTLVQSNEFSMKFQKKLLSLKEHSVLCYIRKIQIHEHFQFNFVPDEEEAVKNVSLSQPFAFRSAYELNPPKYTNFTVLFAACLDYIFYESTNLSVIQTIPVPSDKELKSYSAIPSVIHPSDHVALIADLEWTENE